jgi:hypothetical protein
MKKIIYTIVVMLFGAGGYLQAQSLGFEAGGGASSLLLYNANCTPFFAYRAGVFIVETDSSNRYSETGLAYQKTGGRATGLLEHYAGSARNIELDAHYVELFFADGLRFKRRFFKTPVSFTYKWGVYVRYALAGSGRIAYDTGAGALMEKEIDNIFQDASFSHGGESYPFAAFKRWDFGIRLGIDISVKNYSLRFLGTRGLVNTHPGGLDKEVQNITWMISLGYIL